MTHWDTTYTERLQTLAYAGLSLTEIANEMERSNNAIRISAKQLSPNLDTRGNGK